MKIGTVHKMKKGTVHQMKIGTVHQMKIGIVHQLKNGTVHQMKIGTVHKKKRRDSKLNEKRDITLKELLSFCDVNVMTANHCSSRHKLNTLEVMFNVYSGLSRHVSKSKKYGFLRVV